MKLNNILLVAVIIAAFAFGWGVKPDTPPEVGEKIIRVETSNDTLKYLFQPRYPDVPKIPIEIIRTVKVEKDSGFYSTGDVLRVLNDSTDLTVKASVVIDSQLTQAVWKWEYINKPFYFTRDIIKTEKVYVELPHKLTFWDRFSHGFQIGVGYGLINKQPDIFVGYGLHFRVN